MDRIETKTSLVRFIEESMLVKFGENGIDEETDLFEAGIMDSYGLVEIVTFMESEFAVSFVDEELLSPQWSTLAGMVELVSSKSMQKAGQ